MPVLSGVKPEAPLSRLPATGDPPATHNGRTKLSAAQGWRPVLRPVETHRLAARINAPDVKCFSAFRTSGINSTNASTAVVNIEPRGLRRRQELPVG